MNKNTNLCEILKGHEGETFYCSYYGEEVELVNVNYIITLRRKTDCPFDVYGDGSIYPGGEILLFPSKNQRDWSKWVKEQKLKTPKTWNELTKTNNFHIYRVEHCCMNEYYLTTDGRTSIEKSALALLKIHQLIEVSYGGNVTNEEWGSKDSHPVVFTLNTHTLSFMAVMPYWSSLNGKCDFKCRKELIAFHTKEQAEEFLSYEENIQLLKDYFMI